MAREGMEGNRGHLGEPVEIAKDVNGLKLFTTSLGYPKIQPFSTTPVWIEAP